jgi:hypothetical protein
VDFRLVSKPCRSTQSIKPTMTLSNSNIRQAAAEAVSILDTIVYPKHPMPPIEWRCEWRKHTPLVRQNAVSKPSPPPPGAFHVPMNMDWDIMRMIGAQVKQIREDEVRQYHVERYEEHCFRRRNKKGRLVKSWADNQLRTVVRANKRCPRRWVNGRPCRDLWLCLPADRIIHRDLCTDWKPA